MSPGAAHYRYIGAFVEELARAGLRHVCFAPGSRSTPLAVMLAECPEIELWTHLDERSAAFFALGKAKASREPVGLLCSSGTAAANFYPAVIEARYSRVPLVVMTADRPPELRDVGAPQTIDQNRLYGEHVRWFCDLGLPEDTPEMRRYVRSVAGRAVSVATAEPRGAVHLNFPFREPLMPIQIPAGENGVQSHGSLQASTFAGVQGERDPHRATIHRISDHLHGHRRGLIVCGPQDDPELGPAVLCLGRALGFPVLADPLSHVRTGNHHDRIVLDSYDAFLRDPSICAALDPELIIRFGAMPTAKPFLLYSQRYPDVWQVLVDGGDGWNDPALTTNDVVHADPTRFCDALSEAVESSEFAADPAWMDDWIRIDRTARDALRNAVDAYDDLFEGRVFQELARVMPPGSTLYAGNSMPVRDMDTFFPGSSTPVRFLSNRGANGIDGVVSSALGASTAGDGPLVLVIGDLSFYHDMNGLLAAKLHDLAATIVLVNNDGGGIFSFLPQAAYPEHFEALFGTPHGLDFRPAAELYGLEHTRISSWPEFTETVARSLNRTGVQVIEVPAPNRTSNVDLHQTLWHRMSAELDKLDLACRVNA